LHPTSVLIPTILLILLGTIVGWVVGIAIGFLIVRMIVTRRRAQSGA